MSTDIPSAPPPLTPSSSEPPLLERIGLSGKLLGGGAIVGIIALFLPLVSVSTNMGAAAEGNPLAGAFGKMNVTQSASSIDGWRGVVCLLAYAAALASVFMLYPLKNPQQRNLLWAPLVAGGVATLFALWLLFLVRNAGGGADLGALGSVKTSIGFGGFLNLIAAGVVAYGGFLKAKEERLI